MEKVSVATRVPDEKTPKDPESTTRPPGCFDFSFSLPAAKPPTQTKTKVSDRILFIKTDFTRHSWVLKPAARRFLRQWQRFPYPLLSHGDRLGDMTKAAVRTVS